ncbi:MAG TPA: hypothetical protein DCM28_21015 [Phycisphaerales bacterium]|nr:hypothetical protein [Phycisphaerales bacterium]HCD33698.1 hypothetical protein [Phycisphaerales bacterium]
MCGFGSPGYFTKLYQNEHQLTPHQWRQQQWA